MYKQKLLSTITIMLLVLNIIMVLTPVNAQTSNYVAVNPPYYKGDHVGETFQISINVSVPGYEGHGMFGYAFKFYWDRALINATGCTVYRPSAWGSRWMDVGGGLKWNYNTTHGRYDTATTALDPAPEVYGNFTLVTIDFEVVHKPVYPESGSCLLKLVDTALSGEAGFVIPHETYDGLYEIEREMPPPPTIYVNPQNIIDSSLVECKNFTIDINVLDVTNLYSWEFKLYYKNNVLKATNASEGPFLKSSGSTNFQIKELNENFNSTHGLVWLNCTLLSPPGVSGNGTLATILFHVESSGESVLDLSDTVLKDPLGFSFPHEVRNGYFSNILVTKIYVDPKVIFDPNLTPSSEISINIRMQNVVNLYSYEFNLTYNTDILTCLGAVVKPPPNNETNFHTDLSINDENGYAYVNVTYYPPAEPIHIVNATVTTIYFQIQGYGCSDLNLTHTRIENQHGETISHKVENGRICTVIRDVAIIHVEPSRNAVYPGQIVNITVVATNLGNLTEEFNVTAYYDSTVIGVQEVIDLNPNENVTLTFTWDTTGLEPCRNYTIRAEASVVPYETKTENNVYSDGEVKIKMLGDANGDGSIDLYDLSIVGTAFLCCPGDPCWDERADLNFDGIVNLFDLVIVGTNYGQTC
ncbi:MAG: CARDB domain-containing protein [Thermoproteota archaeon]|nr:CARDB domain-containing protein [Thermoproteota archaeon]